MKIQVTISIKNLNNDDVKSNAITQIESFLNYEVPETKEELVKILEIICFNLRPKLDYTETTIYGADHNGKPVKRVSKIVE